MGKNWNRKRKAQERASKSGKARRDRDSNGGGGKSGTWAAAPTSNAKLESYYSLVGLHDTRYDADRKEFVPCETDGEKTAERDRFMSSLRTILPTSFRVDRSLDPTIQENVLRELDDFAGKEMEVEIELPRHSAAIGGRKQLVDDGLNDRPGEGEQDDGSDKAKQAPSAETNGDYEPVIVKRKIAPAVQIPFIRDARSGVVLGYQISVDKRTLRRNQSLGPFHAWMKVQTDCGHITRQEQVSMIPPVVLDAKPGMAVLDMCAAPGSKTCQILEVVGDLKGDESGGEGRLEPAGYVVANDADPKRAYMLVNQLRRMNNPAVFVTSCDGQYFPVLDSKSDRGTEREGSFDRVLADVPCSGDGTVRKNPGIWRQWNHLGSLALHPLQLSIALRGARLTKVGGYIVYSTCSMNPAENESVVAELLRLGEGSLVLEDPRSRMDGLIARPGWKTWRVLRESKNRTRKAIKDQKKKRNAKMMAKKKEWDEKVERGEAPPPKERSEGDPDERCDAVEPSPYDTDPYIAPSDWSYESLSERTKSLGFVEYASFDDVEDDWRKRVRRSLFPPTEEEAERFELHKCLRCLPQDMDTGGFFVALLKKVGPLGKNATGKMDSMAREMRGLGEEEVPAAEGAETSCSGKEGGEAKEQDPTPPPAEKSAAEDGGKEKSADAKPKEVIRAPIGKAGQAQNKMGDYSQEDFVAADPDIWPAIVEDYGLSPSFPRDQFMCRSTPAAKVIYFVTDSIKSDLLDRGVQDRVTVINSGVKSFERCKMGQREDNDPDSTRPAKGSYRVAQEGVHFIVPHMTKRVVSADADDFAKCLREGFLRLDSFGDDFAGKLGELEQGSFVVALRGHEDDMVRKMFLVMWRRRDVVNCFVSKIEKEAIRSKLRALGCVESSEGGEVKEEKAPDAGGG